MQLIQPIILAGGSGMRLWPLSRETCPKQLLTLTGGHSLLQNTLERVSRLPGIYPPVIVVGSEHRYVARRQIQELDPEGICPVLLEPLGRDTGPAVSGAVEYIRQRRGEDTVVLVFPCDHLVEEEEVFFLAAQQAVALAKQERIVTFGVRPGYPETGYGYIEARADGTVAAFTEKPCIERAREYLTRDNFYWNSGIFVFDGKTFRREMRLHAPVVQQCMEKAVANGIREEGFFCFEPQCMDPVDKISIDYALMEKTACLSVIPVDITWTDIGTWQSFWNVSQKKEDGNVCCGDVIVEGTRNSLVSSEERLVAAIGVEDMVIIETADAVLVSSMAASQRVKEVVSRLGAGGREEFHRHITVHKAWGYATLLQEMHNTRIRRLVIHPGAGMSLHKHYHRHEHWVVVSGTARVTNGKEVFLLHENQSTYVPAGVLHRLANPGVITLEIMEIQIGDYLDEDDIVCCGEGYAAPSTG